MSSKNACKTCALGMGGQMGGMTDEAGKFPEVCKKSMQAMAADMQSGLTAEFFATYNFEQLKQFTPRNLEHMGRLVQPVYSGVGDSHYRQITWDEAIQKAMGFLTGQPEWPPSLARRGKGVVTSDEATRKPEFATRQTPLCPPLSRWEAANPHSPLDTHYSPRVPDEAFFYASGRSSNEAAFAMQLFARVYGTNNVNNCSYYCHQASGVGLAQRRWARARPRWSLKTSSNAIWFSSSAATPQSNHPRLMRTLMKVRRRGGDVIVVNPIRRDRPGQLRVPSTRGACCSASPIASCMFSRTSAATSRC